MMYPKGECSLMKNAEKIMPNMLALNRKTNFSRNNTTNSMEHKLVKKRHVKLGYENANGFGGNFLNYTRHELVKEQHFKLHHENTNWSTIGTSNSTMKTRIGQIAAPQTPP